MEAIFLISALFPKWEDPTNISNGSHIFDFSSISEMGRSYRPYGYIDITAKLPLFYDAIAYADVPQGLNHLFQIGPGLIGGS
jgi:hypothetical protein